MLLAPISNQPLRPLRKLPFDHLKSLDLKDATEIPVNRMEMRHPMLSEVHQSARDFLEWAIREKQPKPWQVEQWKEAIRWFFREGQRRQAQSGACAGPEEAEPEPAVWLPPEKEGWPEWKAEFLKTVRRRHYSYRTEQSYLVWLERCELAKGTRIGSKSNGGGSKANGRGSKVRCRSLSDIVGPAAGSAAVCIRPIPACVAPRQSADTSLC